jgi:hypothetical protein
MLQPLPPSTNYLGAQPSRRLEANADSGNDRGYGLAELSLVSGTPDESKDNFNFSAQVIKDPIKLDARDVADSEVATLYAPDYQGARSHFINSASRVGATLESFPLRARGVNGEELSIDIATIGKRSAQRGVLVIGGAHGVEGFTGSAIECATLDRLVNVPDDVSISFLHCLNPFGMYHLRRGNEDNVDLNRNFLGIGVNYTGIEKAHAEFDTVIQPRTPPSSSIAAQLRLIAGYLRYSFPDIAGEFLPLRYAVMTGQYERPNGVFYGGSKPAESAEILERWMRNRYHSATSLVGIDLHAGLGKWGGESLFVEYPVRSKALTNLEERLGLPLVGLGPERKSYRPRGALADAVPRMLPNVHVDWILQEFGTYNPFRVLAAMSTENAWHNHAVFRGEHLPFNHWSKRELCEVFNPASSAWRRSVIEKGLRLMQAVARCV